MGFQEVKKMEKKTAAILAVALVAIVLATAGGAYALDRQSYSSQTAAYSAGMGPGMMGGHPGGMMGGGHMANMMHQYDYNYTHLYDHEYLWNYCNRTSTG